MFDLEDYHIDTMELLLFALALLCPKTSGFLFGILGRDKNWECSIAEPCTCNWDTSWSIPIIGPGKSHTIDCSGRSINDSNIPQGIKGDKRGKINTLIFDNNAVTTLPDNYLQHLRALTNISIASNRLKRIPKTILSVSTLKHIDLKFNQISLTPNQDGTKPFQKLQSVLYLDLSNNRISQLWVGLFSGMPGLKFLSLSNNLIASLQPQIFQNNTNLEQLSLASNKLSGISSHSFLSQHRLSQLDLSGNMIRQLTYLSLTGLRRLVQLDLCQNRLGRLYPQGMVIAMPELKVLLVDGNRLPSLTITFGKLQRLSASRNPLVTINLSTATCKSVSDLNLASNRLSSSSVHAFLSKCSYPQLIKIDLSRNPLSQLPKTLSSFPKLTTLGIGSTKISTIYECQLNTAKLQYLQWARTNITCNCDIKWLHKWYTMRQIQSSKSTSLQFGWKCYGGRWLSTLRENDLKCDNSNWPIKCPASYSLSTSGSLFNSGNYLRFPGCKDIASRTSIDLFIKPTSPDGLILMLSKHLNDHRSTDAWGVGRKNQGVS